MATTSANFTPFKYGIAGNERYRQILYTVPELQREYAFDMLGRFFGPHSPQLFMKELMSITDETLAKMPQNVKFNMPRALSGNSRLLEKQIYQAFLSFIKRFMLSPNLHFFICADKKKPDNNVKYRPDAGMKEIKRPDCKELDQELKQLKEVKEFELVPPTSPRPAKLHRYATRAKANPNATLLSTEDSRDSDAESQAFDWCSDSLLVEFKTRSSQDPFYTAEDITKKQDSDTSEKADTRFPFEKPSPEARSIRGQLTLYASEMFAHQQRTHLFQLLVCGNTARFLFWDRAGAITSDTFKYTTQAGAKLLAEFFWRFNHMTDEARGVDLTARGANDEEKGAFSKKIREFIGNVQDENHRQRNIPNAEHTLEESYPVYTMMVKDEKSEMELLVQRPFFKATSAIGRGTRGYVAVDKQTKEVLFLKDTWRVNHPLMKTESEVYRILEVYRVPHVPRIICGGDVKDSNGKTQVTISVAWAESQKLRVAYAKLRNHAHHRIVQRLAYPIESADNSEEYVTAFRDVLIVIEKASATEHKILHRDISIGNVMLGDTEDGGVGLLSDWDHACVVDPEKKHEYKNQKFRTGTWAFMSIGMLQNPLKAHEILDDCESIFWTMLYGALHRFKHNGPRFDMSIFTETRHQENADGTASRVGGIAKKHALTIMDTLAFVSTPLRELLATLAEALDDYYTAKYKFMKAERRNNPSTLSAARKAFDEHHAMLSDPAYWRRQFDFYLDQKGWVDDVVAEDPYPEMTADRATQRLEEAERSTWTAATASDVPEAGPSMETNDQDDDVGWQPSDNEDVGVGTEDELDGIGLMTASQITSPTRLQNLDPSSPASSQPQAYRTLASGSSQSSHASISPSTSSRLKRSRDDFEGFAPGSSNRETRRRQKKFKSLSPIPAPIFKRRGAVGRPRTQTGEADGSTAMTSDMATLSPRNAWATD
ncbi:hypothetical protein BC835DRAFT_1423088 [Cytidiella melzeri]|nr:hypothetical protein BC835DRAFT_1423088 [Cytidiella melzeri]